MFLGTPYFSNFFVSFVVLVNQSKMFLEILLVLFPVKGLIIEIEKYDNVYLLRESRDVLILESEAETYISISYPILWSNGKRFCLKKGVSFKKLETCFSIRI